MAAIATNGNGGGRKDFAQAGGKDVTLTAKALASVTDEVKKTIMKILGLDLGSKTLGVAISDALELSPIPSERFKIETNSLQDALNYVKILVSEHNISKVVLGLPKNMNGSIGFQADYSLEFKKMLENELHLEVIMIDERLNFHEWQIKSCSMRI